MTAAFTQLGWLPKLVRFIFILVLGYILARLIKVAVRGLLHRIGFNRLVERGGVKDALARINWDASELLARAVEWFILLFVLELAFGVFGPNAVTAILQAAIEYLPRVFAAGVIVVIGATVAILIRDIVIAAMVNTTWGSALATAGSVGVWFITIFAALDVLAIAPAIVTGLFYAALAAWSESLWSRSAGAVSPS